jgi:hypothetical protein
MNLNSKYKATVFTALFSDKANLLELYNAIKGSHYDAATTEITINTLQDTLFMSKINDISFTVCGKLIILIEHQSTLNPNISLFEAGIKKYGLYRRPSDVIAMWLCGFCNTWAASTRKS